MGWLGICKQCGELSNEIHSEICPCCARGNEDDEILDRPTDYDNED